MYQKAGIETTNLINLDSKTKGIDKDGLFEVGALVNAKYQNQLLHARIIARSILFIYF